MKSLVTFLLFSLWSFATSAEATTSTCSPKDLTVTHDNGQTVNFGKVDISLKYDRNNLAAYEYFGTPSVNLYLPNVEITFEGGFDANSPNVKTKKSFNGQILGVANTMGYQRNDKPLTDCTFTIVKNKDTKPDSQIADFVDQMLNAASECTKIKLCQDLDVVTEDDYARGKNSPRDFGPMDVRSRTLRESFPEILPPRQQPSRSPPKKQRPANIVEGVNTIVQNSAAAYQQNGGSIKLPNHNERHGPYRISAFDGIFSGLDKLKVVPITEAYVRASPADENPKTVSFNFKLSEATVSYKLSVAGILSRITTRLSETMKDMVFSAMISIDYKPNSCQTTLNQLSMKSLPRTSARVGTILSVNIDPFVDAINQKIFQAVTDSIKFTINKNLESKTFNCELYRS